MIGFFVILLSYTALILYHLPEIPTNRPEENGILVVFFGLTSIFAGILAGIIAPFSRKMMVKYIALIYGNLAVLIAIIILIFGEPLWEETDWIGLRVLIIIIMLLGTTFGVIFLTAGGVNFGASLGCKIGRKIQKNYAKEEEDAEKSLILKLGKQSN